MTTAPYHLTVDGVGPLRVHSLRGKEGISETWQFDVVVSGALGEAAERAALGQRATLIFDFGDKQRAFYGVVSAMAVDEVHRIDGEVKYAIRVVPRLWLLRRKKRTRVFQGRRIPDIVTSVLVEAGIAVRWALVRGYPQREYCTQYEETDYEFVRRILAEAGIYFYFFGGGPVDGAALAVNVGLEIAAIAGGAAVGAAAGSAAGGFASAAIQMGETLIPGDTIVCADDALCYVPVAGDDPVALAASTAAAMAPAAAADALGGLGGPTGAAVDAASAIAGSVTAALLQASALPIRFMANESSAVSTYDKVVRLGLRNTVRSAGAMFRDYDPDRPLIQLQSVAVSTAPFPPSQMEIAAAAAAITQNAASAVATIATEVSPDPSATAGIAGEVTSVLDDVAGLVKVPSEVYEHHAPFLFPKWSFASDEAPLILRQKRRRASIASGEGGCFDFSPAHRFELHGHFAPQLDGQYVVTRVTHHGEADPLVSATQDGRKVVYFNIFECAPAQMPYPPKRPKRRSVQVALTATVVGPPEEEVHVDEKGQIRVQFHWDREGKLDHGSSCWIRAMQSWAGAGWGAQFIPRVGMEVLVAFLGGDPDQPIVVGCVPNATHPPAFQLPANKTRSGWKTRSTPDNPNAGHNELSFEDAAGAERVAVIAKPRRTGTRHAAMAGSRPETERPGDACHRDTRGVHRDGCPAAQRDLAQTEGADEVVQG